jgi:hypothetical protein
MLCARSELMRARDIRLSISFTLDEANLKESLGLDFLNGGWTPNEAIEA